MERTLKSAVASVLFVSLLISSQVGFASPTAPAATFGHPSIVLEFHMVRVSTGIDASRFDLGRNAEQEEALNVRVELRDVSEHVPTIVSGRTGPIGFLTDLVALNTLLMSLQLSTRALQLEHAHPLPWASGGPTITEPLNWTWRDSNFGDPYFNMIGHPLAFYSMSSYFRQCRGYGQVKSFLGGMVMNFLWETMWENIETPHSLHDLMMNSLGALCGSINGFGLAYGFDALSLGDYAAYYTEFYGETSEATRVFVRFNPMEDFVTQQRLVPWILGLGFGYETDIATLSAVVSALPSTESDAWDPSFGLSVLARVVF